MSLLRMNLNSHTFGIMLPVFFIIILTACTDSASSNPDPIQNNSPAPNAGIDKQLPELNNENSGRIIDGYIESAYLCLDDNNNFICEKSEELHISNNQGRYLASQFSNRLVLAQVIAGISKDKDDHGNTVNTSYVMYSANNNPKLITPFTTLVHVIQQTMPELTTLAVNQLLAKTLSLSEQQLSQDYISSEDSQAKKIAKTIVISIQQILSKGMNNSKSSNHIHNQLQAKVWQKLTLDSLTQLNTLLSAAENSTLDANALSNLWLTAQPQLFFTSTELGNSTEPSNPAEPNGLTDLSVFKKINGQGELVSDDSTHFQCVTQIKDHLGNDISSNQQRSWMLLIPALATYKSLGFVPAGLTENDKFWDYTWDRSKDSSLQPKFKDTNGLIRQYSNDDNVEHFLTLLNQHNYCGFSDWTVPTVASLKTLNTQPLTQDSTIKTLNTRVFKYYPNHVEQIKNRQGNNRDLRAPYFWSNDRTSNDDGSSRVGMNDFSKYHHPSTELTSVENTAGGKLIDAQLSSGESITGGQYHALRAVRYPRYQRIDDSGKILDLTTTQWACIKDIGPIDNRYNQPRYWSTLLANDLNVFKSEISTILGQAISGSRCGFNNWRLPTAAELIALKSMNSDQYFIAVNAAGSNNKLSTFSNDEDYYWLDTVSTHDDKIQLWSHNDMLVSSSGTPTHSAHTLLINNVTTTIPSNSDCADINGKQYCAFHEAKSWADSKTTCEAQGLMLAIGSLLSDTNHVATQLKLDPGNSAYGYKAYWLANEWTGRDDYASTLRNTSTPPSWEMSATKMAYPRGFICSSDTGNTPDANIPTPPAPNAGTLNDALNTFSWTPVTLFINASDYEYSTDNATSWSTALTNPIQLGDISVPRGHFQLRVKALPSANNSGLILKSSTAFTINVTNSHCSQGDSATQINGNCYTRHDSAKSWADAKDFCSTNNASLITEAAAIAAINTSNLASQLQLASSPVNYWLLDSEVHYGRARALTDYTGEWRAYNKDIRHQKPFICIK